MKNKFIGVLVLSMAIANSVKADTADTIANGVVISTTASSAPLASMLCLVSPSQGNECYYVTTLGLLQITSLVLLKEAQEVKPDAINYAAGESATPALESVVEKIQIAVSEHGKEISFDEVVEALIGL